MGTKANVDIFELLQTLQEHAGAGEQQQGQGKLRYDEPAAEAMAASASLSSAAALLQVLVWIEKGDLPRRSSAENDGRGSGKQGGKEKHIPIQMNVQTGGKIPRSKPQQGTNRLEGNQQTERHAHESQRHAFREHLASQAPRRSAERRANGKLARARGRAGQQKPRDIRTGNQQNQTHSAQEDQQRRAYVTIHEFRERNGKQAPAGGFGIALGARIVANPLRSHFEENRCARRFHASLETRDREIIFIEDVVERKGVRREAQGRPKICLAGPLEILLHDADDFVRLLVELDRTANNVLIAAKNRLPRSVGQNNLVIGVGLIFFRRKDAA